MRYSRKVEDHYQRPRNVGTLPRDDRRVGSGSAGTGAGGDLTRVQVRIDERRGVVVEARFKAFGCTAAIAAASFVTERATGLALAEAATLSPQVVAGELELDGDRYHCAVAAADALKAAVADAVRKQGRGFSAELTGAPAGVLAGVERQDD